MIELIIFGLIIFNVGVAVFMFWTVRIIKDRIKMQRLGWTNQEKINDLLDNLNDNFNFHLISQQRFNQSRYEDIGLLQKQIKNLQEANKDQVIVNAKLSLDVSIVEQQIKDLMKKKKK